MYYLNRLNSVPFYLYNFVRTVLPIGLTFSPYHFVNNYHVSIVQFWPYQLSVPFCPLLVGPRTTIRPTYFARHITLSDIIVLLNFKNAEVETVVHVNFQPRFNVGSLSRRPVS